MRVYEFTNAEEQYELLTRIVNLTRSQIKDEHLLRNMGTNDSGGESTLDFVKRLIDNTFSEIDDWEMERSVGFDDHDDFDQKSTQSTQTKKPTTKKTLPKSVNIKPLMLKNKPVKAPQKPVKSADKKSSVIKPNSLEPLTTTKSIPTQKFKSFTGTNL